SFWRFPSGNVGSVAGRKASSSTASNERSFWRFPSENDGSVAASKASSSTATNERSFWRFPTGTDSSTSSNCKAGRDSSAIATTSDEIAAGGTTERVIG